MLQKEQSILRKSGVGVEAGASQVVILIRMVRVSSLTKMASE